MNVLHFATNEVESDVAPPSPLLVALIAAVVDCVITALLPAVTQDWTFEYADGRYVHNSGGSPFGSDPVVQTPPPDSVGELGVCSVSFASSLVNIRTGIGGKTGRGKMFLPPPGEAQTTNGVMDASTATALQAFLTCMAGKFLGTTPSTVWRWGVFSRKLGGANYSSFDAGFHIAANISPVPTLAVISRRKIGHGN
jgi:hypothetical protein